MSKEVEKTTTTTTANIAVIEVKGNALDLSNRENAQKAIVSFIDQIKGIHSVADALPYLNSSALAGREVWVRTALIARQATKGLAKKDRTAKIKELKDKLNYGTTQIYAFIEAGEYLEKGDGIDNIPFSCKQYLSQVKPKKGKKLAKKIKAIVEIGKIMREGVPTYIYDGIRVYDENTTKSVTFASAVQIPDGRDVDISDLDGETTYTAGMRKTRDGKGEEPITLNPTFISL